MSQVSLAFIQFLPRVDTHVITHLPAASDQAPLPHQRVSLVLKGALRELYHTEPSGLSHSTQIGNEACAGELLRSMQTHILHLEQSEYCFNREGC